MKDLITNRLYLNFVTSSRRSHLNKSASLSEIMSQHGERLSRWDSYGYPNVSFKDVNDKLNSLLITGLSSINRSATLYFDKSCTFPRYKLQGTDFKRCVKLDKADYIIIPDITKFRLYDVPASFDYMLTIDDNIYLYSKGFYEYYDELKQGVSSNITHFLECYSKSALTTVISIALEYNKPLIYEADLDKIISKDLEKLDDESLMSIFEMMSSQDEASIELGCKLLASYDVYETTLASAMLLFLTQKNWIRNKGAKSVSFTSMLQNLKYPHYGFSNVDYIFQNFPISSDKDKHLAQLLVEPWIRQIIEEATQFKIEKCPFKIELNIEIE